MIRVHYSVWNIRSISIDIVRIRVAPSCWLRFGEVGCPPRPNSRHDSPHFGRRPFRPNSYRDSSPPFRNPLPRPRIVHPSTIPLSRLLQSLRVGMVHPQVSAQVASLRDPDAFWLPLANKSITWIKPPTKALVVDPPKWSWFPDGTLNTCYNCVDRHPSSRIAIEYVSPVAKTKESITYGQLRERVESVAAILKNELSVKKGDTVIIYSMFHWRVVIDE